MAAVREAVGPDVQIMIEMHGRFTPAAKHQRTKPSPSGSEGAAGREPQPRLAHEALAEVEAILDALDARASLVRA